MKRGIKTSALIVGIIGMLVIFLVYGVRVGTTSYLMSNPYLYVIGTPIITIGVTLLLTWLLVTKVMKMSMADFGMGGVKVSAKWVIIGLVLPLAVVGIYLLMPGEFTVGPQAGEQFTSAFGSGVATVPLVLLTDILYVGATAGICEEIIFRGLLMHLVGRKWGVVAGVLVSAFLFPLVHIVMMGHIDFASIIMLFIGGGAVGAMFCMITLASNDNISNSAIVHALWDVFVGGLFSIYATEASKGTVASLFTKHLDVSSLLITGGGYEIDVALIGTAAYIIVFVIAYRQYKKNKEAQPQE